MFQKFWFLIILMLGTLIVMSSNSWLISWMGLEINSMCFITMIVKKKNIFSSESAIIYFIFQALASLLFLFSIINYLILINYFFMLNKIYLLLTLIALTMKIGSAPFHFWIPIIMENLNWFNNLILMTWQKIAPIILIFYMIKFKLLLMFIILSSIISILGGLNQTSIKKLMAFSSINQISWMMMSLMINEIMWKLYMMLYFIIMIMIIMLFNNLNIYFFNQLFSISMKNFMMKLILFMNMMSLGGLPPFLGFFPKFLIIKKMMILNMFFIMLIILMFTLIMLFFYLKIMYSSFMLNMMMFKYMNKNYYMNNIMLLISFMNNFLLMMFLMIYF